MADPNETTTPAAPPSGTAPSPSPSAESSHLDTLVSDRPVERTPETPPTTETPPAAAPRGDAPATTPAAATPPPKYKITAGDLAGREFTLDELAQNGLLDALLKTHDQYQHLQRKHGEMLEKLAQQPAQAQQSQEPAQPTITQSMLRAHYQPQMQEAVKQGWIEQDVVDLYPDLATQLLWHRDQMYQMKDVLGQLAQGFSGTTFESRKEKTNAQLTTDLDALAGTNPVYAPLKDAAERKGYLEWLAREINPHVDRLTPEFHRRMWVAYKSEAILGATQQMTDEQKRRDEDARRRAAGDGRGSRPATPATAPPSHLDSLIGVALPSR